ncbi:glycerol-3-phosphate dehydrogenase [Escherichia coli]|uniref:Glycerol-3-phosphate dehydrogenase n=1 Tax=Escherichia coli TaxID=562 RepID=A0A2X3LP41_ECOLX|nr:glycerol-3-phosphate dehydrogenase [Escherichia coli]
MMLGQGMDVQSAQEKIGQVVEGYRIRKKSANWRIASALKCQ